MAMDVTGIEPTADAGRYFCASVWSWQPLHRILILIEVALRKRQLVLAGSFCADEPISWDHDPGDHQAAADAAPVIFGPEALRQLGFNDGAPGHIDPVRLTALRVHVRSLVDRVASVKNRTDPALDAWLALIDLRVIFHDDGVAIARRTIDGPLGCLADGTFVRMDDPTTAGKAVMSPYAMSLDHLRQFADFLDACGSGFEVR